MAGLDVRNTTSQTILAASTAQSFSAMSRVHDALDDLLHAPRIHTLPLLDGEWVIGGVELHERTRWPGPHVNRRLE
jgi:hypothetical protein